VDLRILVDLQASQSAAHAERGIARYSIELTRALLRRGAPVEGILLNPNLPTPRRLPPELAFSPLLGFTTARTFAEAAALGPAAFHIMSPIELDDPAPLVLSRAGLGRSDALVVVLYDLIPLVFADRYLADPRVREPYLARLQLVRDADLVLAISEHTRRDGIEHLGLDPQRVVNIGGGATSAFAPAAPGDDPLGHVRRARPGITKPYVLTVAGYEWRKNCEGLIEGFARLPGEVRRAHQLVIACSVPPEGERAWRDCARRAGLADDDVVITGFVDEPLLRALYQAAALFVFPSRYEGYGLPALEAACSGVPVLTSDSSSLPEILDLPSSTFPATDTGAMAARIDAALTDPSFRADLLAAGARAAAVHTWDAVADRTIAAYERLDARLAPGRSAGRRRAPRPRVAFVGPLPPVESGVALYNERVVSAIDLQGIDLELFHETPRGTPAPRPPVDVPCYPIEALGTRLDPHDYDTIVYTLGNSGYHVRTFDLARRVPGVLWLHDAYLIGLHLEWALWQIRSCGRATDVLTIFREEMAAMYGPRIPPAKVLVEPLSHHAFVDHQVYLNARVVRSARRLVLNSELAHQMVRIDAGPDGALPPTTVLRHAFPDRSVLPVPTSTPPRERPLVVALGIVHEIKRPDALLRAVAALGRPVDVAFVGPCEAPLERELLDLAAVLGLAGGVTLTGFVDVAEYASWIARADVAVQLRNVSFGESSGAIHDAIAGGVPVVTSIASAADLPADVVTMVAADCRADDLTAAIRAVIDDPTVRARRHAASRSLAEEWSFTRVAHELLTVIRADAAPSTRALRN
jgi:glycosyltransferase involved in cell wall biosynthesis